MRRWRWILGQQRLLLEVCWEALVERAGVDLCVAARFGDTGVFAGGYTSGWPRRATWLRKAPESWTRTR